MAGATMGVTAVTSAGGAVTKTAAATAGNVGRSLATKAGSNGARRKGAATTMAGCMEIFCSDFYTEQFVLDEIDKARKDSKIVSLKLEDLIQRQSVLISKAVTQLLLDTAVTNQEMEDDESEKIMDTSWKSVGRRHSTVKRKWTEVSFTEAISDSMAYQAFVKQKAAFQKVLQSSSNKILTTKVPIKFKAKIELHTLMAVEDVLELLQEIEKDTEITNVDFPMLSRNHKKVPAVFTDYFDVDAMTWKDGASPIEIHLRYGDQDVTLEDFDHKSAFLCMDDKEKVATDVIKQCRCRLDKSSHNVTEDSFSWSDDNVILQEEGVVPKPSKRSSKEVRKARSMSPKRTGRAPVSRHSKGSPSRPTSAPKKSPSRGGKVRLPIDDSRVKRHSEGKQLSPENSPKTSPTRSIGGTRVKGPRDVRPAATKRPTGAAA
jgi:hypothetical protein